MSVNIFFNDQHMRYADDGNKKYYLLLILVFLSHAQQESGFCSCPCTEFVSGGAGGALRFNQV